MRPGHYLRLGGCLHSARTNEMESKMNIRQKYTQWKTYFETVNELKRCSDRSLADVGIRRDEIRAVARRKSGLV